MSGLSRAGWGPTCSLTDARMAEVVSVSDPSPLEAFNTGLSMLGFCGSDCRSGTGIPPAREISLVSLSAVMNTLN